MKQVWTWSLASLLCFPSIGFAEAVVEDLTEIVPDDTPPAEAVQEGGGLDGSLSVAASLNLADNRNVVGQSEGLSTLFGLQVLGSLDYVAGSHELRNGLTISESWARTPAIPRVVKNSDNLEVESLYNYFLTESFGAFSRVAASTTLFETQLVTADTVNYSVTRLDGSSEIIDTVALTLSEPFQPLSLYESLGVFAEPVSVDEITVTTRVGAAARETFAKGTLSVTDDDATADVVEVTELDDVYQAGAEGFVGLTGSFDKKRITYDIGASAFLPLINNDDTERSATDLLRLALVAKASLAFTEWAALQYQFRALDDPQLLDELQIQNSLLLTFQYSLVEAGTDG